MLTSVSQPKPSLSGALNSRLGRFSMVTGFALAGFFGLGAGVTSFYFQAHHQQEMLHAITNNLASLSQNSDYLEAEKVLASFIEHIPGAKILIVRDGIVQVSVPDLQKNLTSLTEEKTLNFGDLSLGMDGHIYSNSLLRDHISQSEYGKVILDVPGLSAAIDAVIVFVFSFALVSLLLIFWRKQTAKKLNQTLEPLKSLHQDLSRIGTGREPTMKPELFEVQEFSDISALVQKQYSDVQNLTKVAAKAEGERRAVESVRSVLHDLANPYTAISNLVQARILYPHDSSIAKDLKKRFGELDNQFLDLLKSARHIQIEALNKTEQSLLGTVKDGINLGAVKNPQTVVLHEPNETILEQICVKHDANLLARAIANIIRNAIEEGATRIEVWLKAEPLEIHIKDNGPGIPQEEISALLEGRLKSKKANGSGIGFPTALRLVRAHNGKIILENNPGEKGAHFKLALEGLRDVI